MMNTRLAIFTVVGATAFILSHMPLAANQASTTTAPAGAKTTWDSVYSDMQAAKGETIYNAKCVRCHGTNGAGADAPTLVGPDFAADWEALTADQLFDRVKTSMPQDDPGSLSKEDTAALLAYTFKLNGFPAGATDLGSDMDALAKIKYVATKP